jgi:hypothetical protein
VEVCDEEDPFRPSEDRRFLERSSLLSGRRPAVPERRYLSPENPFRRFSMVMELGS